MTTYVDLICDRCFLCTHNSASLGLFPSAPARVHSNIDIDIDIDILLLALSSFAQPFDRMISIQKHYFIILGRCLQHRGGEPERAKGADNIQVFALDCIAYIVDAETN